MAMPSLYHDERGFGVGFPRRLIVFLSMMRLEFYRRKIRLTESESVRGWRFLLWTPLFIVYLYSKYPQWNLPFDTLQTSAMICWTPRNWWGIKEGELAMKHQWEKIWHRWLVVEDVWINQRDGSFRKRSHIEPQTLPTNPNQPTKPDSI